MMLLLAAAFNARSDCSWWMISRELRFAHAASCLDGSGIRMSDTPAAVGAPMSSLGARAFAWWHLVMLQSACTMLWIGVTAAYTAGVTLAWQQM